MVYRIVLSAVIIFAFFSRSINAQLTNLTYHDVGELEEYINPQVTSLYQDCRGLLWISTYGGIERWDGNNLIHYPYMPFDSAGFPARTPGGVTGDDQNHIWVLGENLIRFDLETEVFQGKSLSWEGDTLNPKYIKYDHKGFLWMGAMEGIFKYYPAEDSLQRIPVIYSGETEESQFRMISIVQDSTGIVWMAHNQYGLCWLDPDGEVFRMQEMELPDHVDRHMNVGRMKEDPRGNFWLFGRKAELACFNPYTREFRWEGLPVYSSVAPSTWGGLAIDQQNRIWYGTDRGLMQYDPFTKELTALDNTSMLSNITDMITDMYGNIVVGTFEGVKVINPREKGIRTIDVHLEKLAEGDSWLSSVVRDGQIFWLGTFRSGLIRYDLETGQVVNYQADGQPGSINSNYVTKTLRDRSGRIWFTSGWNGSLYRVNPDKNSFEHFQAGESHFITEGNEGNFWVLGRDHIVRFDPLTQDTIHIPFKESLPMDQLRSQLNLIPFIRDHEGIFWFAQQDGGLYRIDAESRKWTHYNYDENNPDGLPDRHVKTLFCDSRGDIWLSTWVGLSKMIKHLANDTLLSFDNHYITDLHLGHTLNLTEDENGNIFAGSISGAIVIRPDGTIARYSNNDGLPENPRKISMVDRDHENGNIYLGHNKLVIIPPSFASPQLITLPTIFTAFRIGGEIVSPGEESPIKASMLLADRIDLRHNQNFFRIDFSAIYLSQPERTRYRFILKGIDADTIYSGNKSYAEYTDLKHGNYTFWVSSASHNGPWDNTGTSIDIRIRPPITKTLAAMVIYLVILISLVAAFVRLRTIRLQRDKIRLEQEVKNRTREIIQKNKEILELDILKNRFFNNISHEFRTLVTMVKAPAETLMEKERLSLKGRGSLELIYRNANKLMLLVNQLLDISRLDKKSLKLSLSEGNIFDFTRLIAASFSPIAETRGIQYLYSISQTDTPYWFDRDKIEKVINNLLSNAFKFTEEGGQVRLSAVLLNKSNHMVNTLEINVSDTGNGIGKHERNKIFDRFYQAESSLKKEGGGTGIGLALTSDLVKLMHGSIRLKSKEGEGSSFKVLIPLGRKHLKESEYTIAEHVLSGPYLFHEIRHDSVIEAGAPSSKAGQEEGTNRPRVLVVEDNPDMLWYVSSQLASAFSVLEAVDGSAALKLARKHMPDLIITDLMMPRMDGYRLCEILKTDILTSHIPVILLTAKASMDDKMLGLETGADDYITKPFEIRELLARTRNLIEQRQKLKEKFASQITLNPHEIAITSTDEKFLRKVMTIVEKYMSDEEFDVSKLCEAMNMSRSTLFRKLDALTNQSPVDFIRTLRLKRAALMLKKKYGNISEVALEVGFSNPSYFAKMFKKSFSVSPSKFAKSYPDQQGISFMDV